ncbi:TPA: hypothetical protein DD394_03275 [bacterium UBP9_UBA11836]|nr:hypothetical protein [bacterium UBP9_UBA11836]
MKKSFIIIDGIKVNIIRKPIKRSVLKVNPNKGEVSVSVSEDITDEHLRSILGDNLRWIKERLAQRSDSRAVPFVIPENEGEEGFCYFWGDKCKLVMQRSPLRSRVYLKEAGLLVMEFSRFLSEQRKITLLDNFLRYELQNELNKIIPVCQDTTELKADEYRIKKMTSRWGTCNLYKKRVWISLNLVYRSRDCLRYVVIHELTHLLEGSHNYIFKRYLDKFYPGWRAIKKKLALPLGTATS